uniref:Uncharacterized protein n=1 Tax=Peronospora matthiolae TaxID=2874970 RepID=A0AAV1TCN4_9STRA
MAPFAHKSDTMLDSEATQLGRDPHVLLLETIRGVLRPKTTSVALFLGGSVPSCLCRNVRPEELSSYARCGCSNDSRSTNTPRYIWRLARS